MISKIQPPGTPDHQTEPAADLPTRPLGDAIATVIRHLGLEQSIAPEAVHRIMGSRPTRSALETLGEITGLSIRVGPIAWRKIDASDLPAIVLTKDNTAHVVTVADATYVHVLVDEGTRAVPRDRARGDLGQEAIWFSLDSTRLIKSVSTPDTEGQSFDLRRWVASHLWATQRHNIVQMILAAGLSNLFLIALPLFIMSVYDRVIPHSAFESLQTLTIGICLVLCVDAGLRFARLKFTDAVALSLSSTLQRHLFRRLVYTRYAARPKESGQVASAPSEIENFATLLPDVMIGVIADVTFAILVMIMILSLGGPIALAPLLGIATIVGIIAIATLGSTKQQGLSGTLKSTVAGQFTETVGALLAVKATGAEERVIARHELTDAMLMKQLHQARQSGRFALQAAGLVVQAIIVATVIFGVVRITAGSMSIGSLAAITILVGRAVMPIGQLTDNACRLWVSGRRVAHLLSEIIAAPTDAPTTSRGTDNPIKGSIRLTDVSVSYPAATRPSLAGLSLNIKQGERVAIIGPNGSGKSTLLQLITRLVDPTAGEIAIDDHDLSQWPTSWLRQHIGFMPAETVLFQGTLRENVCLGETNLSTEAFAKAVTLSGVATFAQRHPLGYDMQVGPRGDFLSAGERQAVGLARILVRPRSVYILDEPTSLMDQKAESQVIETLKSLPGEATLLLTTHRLRLLETVDRVITLDRGRVLSDIPKGDLLAAQRQKAAG